MTPADSNSFPPKGTGQTKELERVWNKWTSVPVPPESEQACLDSTHDVYEIAAKAIALLASVEGLDSARNAQEGEELGQTLGFLTRVSYMLGLDHTTSRRSHPFTASSLASQLSYAMPLINEASKPAYSFFTRTIARAIALGALTREAAESFAGEVGQSLARVSATCYRIGSLDAERHPLPYDAQPLPRIDALTATWGSYALPSESETELLELSLSIEGAVHQLIDALSFHWPIGTGPVHSFELREKFDTILPEATKIALFLGLHAAHTQHNPKGTLPEAVYAALIVVSAPLLSFIADIPNTGDLRDSVRERYSDACTDIARLAIVGLCRAYFIGFEAPKRQT